MGVTIKTPTDAANALLGALGIKSTKQDVIDLEGWANTEHSPSDFGGDANNPNYYNPWDTSLPEPGSHGTNADNIQSYTSWQQGIEATAQTLEDSNPSYNYAGIIAALQDNASWSQFTAAVENSSWGGKGSKYLTKFPTPPGIADSGTSTPDSQENALGSSAAQSANTSDNSPSTTTGSDKLYGMAGILQAMNQMYNPAPAHNVLWVIPNVPADIEHTSIEIFTRAASAIVAVIIFGIGLKTMLSGTSDSGGSSSGGGAAPALTFINQQQRNNQADARIAQRNQLAQDVAKRHSDRLANDEANRQNRVRVASTPRVVHKHETKTSVIRHESNKPKPKVKVKWMPNPTSQKVK